MDFSVSDETLTLYKLMVLYMLDRVSFPLTQSQISEFILGQGYTNYMVLRQVIGELTDTGLIASDTVLNRTRLTITKEGRSSLGFFENRISSEIKEEILSYFKAHSLELRNEVSVVSNYYKTVNGEYEAILSAKDRDSSLIELKLTVPTREIAASVCEHWQKKNQEVYQVITRMLF